MTTGATLFSGGEGVGVGMKSAGITHLWGIEIDNDIAQVARDNGFNTITADVLDVDPASLEVPDILHASPVCTRASVANQNAREDTLDIAAAQKTAEFIDVIKPRIFTLENVYPYRKFEAFGIILSALERNGYMYDYGNLNAADFGVPQTRRRLILRAVRGALLPPQPPAEKWIGWYEAIEDLIPELPESEFAPWQKGLPLSQSIIVGSHYGQSNKASIRTAQFRTYNKPIFTITISNVSHNDIRAYLVSGQNAGLCKAMTMATYLRFQTFPDDYKNPIDVIIGNAVPPLMYEKIVRQLIGVTR